MTPGHGPRVSVVVATMDRWDDLRETLPRHRPAPVVLVDNGSHDSTPDLVAQAFPEVTVIRLARNAGAVARNVGVASVETPYVAFADDDSWWEPGALERAADLLDANPRVGLVAARILVGEVKRLEPVCEDMAESALGAQAGEPGVRVLGFIACGAVVRRTAFLQAGGFDPVVFFPGEEERLALDLAALGWSLCYVPEVVARHVPSQVRDRPGRPVVIARNLLLTAVMRRPWREVARTAWRICHTRKGARGLVEALPRLPAALGARRPLPPQVERSRRLLDARAAKS